MRLVVRVLLGLVALMAGYGLAAAIGSAVPVNGGSTRPAEGVRIFVADNGVHTDLIVPAASFRDLVRPGDIADPRLARRGWLAIGWGDRDFYLNTPGWTGTNPLRAFAALVGAGRTVLHVAHIPEPGRAPHIRSVKLRPEEYRRLVAHVRETFAGRSSVRGYGRGDAFYEARGGYSAWNTCNEWTGSALRKAGARMGAWTPLTFGVMRWL